MLAFKNIPINRKLTILMMLTVGASLVLASASFVANDWITFKNGLIDNLSSSAQVVGANSQAALLFSDQTSAEETLSALRARKSVIAAVIYDVDGGLFAQYLRAGAVGDFSALSIEVGGHKFHDDYVDLFSDIVMDGERVGTVLIRSDLAEMRARLQRYAGIVTLVLIASIFLGYLLFSKLRRLITDPIMRLSDTAKSITNEKDFSVRAVQDSEDEIGTLIAGFNEMLAEIQERDKQLEDHRQHLEDQVVLRTAELSKSNKLLQKEIVERRQVQEVRQRYQDGLEKLDKWVHKLIETANRKQQFYDIACEGIADLVNADLATLPLVDGNGEDFTYVAAAGLGAEQFSGKTMPILDGELEAWVIRNREVLCIPDITSDTELVSDSLKSLGVTSCLIVPLLHSDSMVGALNASRCGTAFDVVDKQILTLFGQRVSTALDNLQLLINLEEEKERAEVTLHSIGDAVITTDGQGLVTFLNPIAERLTGWTNGEAKGLPVNEVFIIANETTGERIEDPVARCLRSGEIIGSSDHALMVGRDGDQYAINESAAPIRDRKGEIMGVVMVFHDVSRERELKNQLSWQAAHDGLTGLANRRAFEERLDSVLLTAAKDDGMHALLYLDLDQFKIVNDTCGHVAGDELLRQLSALLRQNVRNTDTLARLGGDEFGVLLEGCPLDQARDIAEVLRAAINRFRFAWENKTFEVGVSIGLVPIRSGSGVKSEVLSAADVACYAAKDFGRNRVHVHQPEDAELARRHGEIRWVSRITEALQDDRLQLFRQSIVPVSESEVADTHYEILVRMRDEEGNIVPPGAFIPAAERYNLMPAIDRWVISHAIACYEPGVAYSINLSGTSLSDDSFLDFIRDQLSAPGVPPSAFCFEVTETAAIANLSQATEVIRELKELGCMFALDDFGSGLSSFAYLKNLPVDYLKIDGQFVQGMVDDPIDQAMVKSINEIGHVMGMRTIAEFVETQEILEALREIGVDYAQGYGIDKPHPMPARKQHRKVVNSN